MAGQKIEFRSEEHFGLIERALRAKFNQCNRAKRARLATGDTTLTHDVGKSESPHTSLPAAVFIQILYKVQAELEAEASRDGVIR